MDIYSREGVRSPLFRRMGDWIIKNKPLGEHVLNKNKIMRMQKYLSKQIEPIMNTIDFLRERTKDKKLDKPNEKEKV